MRVPLWFGLSVEALALWFILMSLNIFFSSRDKKDILLSLEPKHLLDPHSSRIEHFPFPLPPLLFRRHGHLLRARVSGWLLL